MRRKRVIRILLILFALIFGSAGVVCIWYFQPLKAEDLNRMPCCYQGPLEAKFENGQIIACSSPHPETFPPGTVVGTYKIRGNQIEITMSRRSALKGTYELGYAGAEMPGGPQGPDVPYAAWSYGKHWVEALVAGDRFEYSYTGN
jgi:hypothetical protein